jgi:hypothetical protein
MSAPLVPAIAISTTGVIVKRHNVERYDVQPVGRPIAVCTPVGRLRWLLPGEHVSLVLNGANPLRGRIIGRQK